MMRARLTKVRVCVGCQTRLPAAEETSPRAYRDDLCSRCLSRAVRALLRPCRN